MRVSDSLMYQTASLETARAREAAQRAQEVASSGARVVHPGDDPAAAGAAVAFHMSSDRFGAIAKATAAASDELGAADNALGDVTNQLARARELAMQFGSASYSASQRTMGAQEVTGIIAQVVSDLNTRFGNRYIFGGTQDAAPPFDASGAFSGNDGVRQVEIAPGVLEQSNVQAGVYVKGTAGGVDLFAVLGALRDALQNNDPAAVQASLAGIDDATSQVSSARAQVGVAQSALDSASAASKLSSTTYETQAGKETDADVIEASIKLQQTQTALQASLAATAKSFQLSLLDYLK